MLFAVWFASGLAMIYVPYPSLTKAERLAHLQPIDWSAVTVPAPSQAGLRSVVLEMRDGHPIWRLMPWKGEPSSVSAQAGYVIAPVDAAMAMRVASRFGNAPVVGVEEIARDQWTVAAGFDRHRPLWKASLDDDAGGQVYVSSGTGDVVQETTRKDRFWNWLGSVPHWIYPTILRQHGEAWRQVVLWVSGPCMAAGITGLWIGILRTRLGHRRFKGGRVTPYHGWMLWHHVAGLVGGIFLVGWIFSGWLSVDPGHLLRSEGIADAALQGYAGEVVLPAVVGRAFDGAVRVEAISAAGQPLLLVSEATGKQSVLDGRSLQPFRMPPERIARFARRLIPGAPVLGIDRLTSPDAYWYEAGSLPRLPVTRIRFGDPAAAWVHIAPETGEIMGTVDARGRTYRWLFDLLHKWDLNALTLHRPLWDAMLWTLSLLGLVTSVSGVWIGWKRLRKPRHARAT